MGKSFKDIWRNFRMAGSGLVRIEARDAIASKGGSSSSSSSAAVAAGAAAA